MKFWKTALLIAGLVLPGLSAPSWTLAQDREHRGYEGRGGDGERGGDRGGYGQERGRPQFAPGRGFEDRRGPPAGPVWGAAPRPNFGDDRYGYGRPGPAYIPRAYPQPFFQQRYAPPPTYGRWRRGQFLPPSSRGYAISDYTRYHLRRPPRGYYWCRSGSDFILVAVATGLIFEVIGDN